MTSYSIGIDLGGTAIKVMAADPEGNELSRHTQPTQDGIESINDWATHLRRILNGMEIEHEGPPQRIGIAAPGLAARDGTCISHLPGKLHGLEGFVWSEALRSEQPVEVMNDAHAALLGEVWAGIAKGKSDVVLLTLGTGVGGAILSGGKLLRGTIGRAGHLGHMCMDPDGRPSILGMPGAIEVLIGNYTIQDRSGKRFSSTQELVHAFEEGDADASRIWLESVRALGCAIASYINMFDPELIVLAGGITKAGPSLLDPLAAVLDEVEWCPGGTRVPVVISELGEWAGAIGMASLAFESH